jgi:pilus assembly protein CpaE
MADSKGTLPDAGRLIALHCGKGGVGRTTLAINVACVLAQEHQKRVAVVDLDLQFGDLATIVEIPAIHGSILDVVTAPLEDIDANLVQSAMVAGPAGTRLLACPPRPELAEIVESHREGVQRLLEVLRQEYDFVIIDGGRFIGEAGATLLEMADTIMLVTTATALSLKSLRLTLGIIEGLAVHPDRVAIVLNRLEPHANFGVSEVETNLGHRVMAVVPHDPKLPVNAIDSGVPFVLSWPRAPISVAVRKLADHVARSPQRAAAAAQGVGA